jgi:hypothetical protein
MKYMICSWNNTDSIIEKIEEKKFEYLINVSEKKLKEVAGQLISTFGIYYLREAMPLIKNIGKVSDEEVMQYEKKYQIKYPITPFNKNGQYVKKSMENYSDVVIKFR